SLSDSSSETSSDSHSDTSSDSSLRHSSSGYAISDSPCDSLTTIFARPSRKRCRYLTKSVPVASLVRGAISPVRANLFLPRKRIRDFDSVTNFEDSSKEEYVSYADIDACTAFVDDIAARGTDVRVEMDTTTEKEAESSVRGTIEIRVDRVSHLVVSDDTTEPVRDDLPELVHADGSLEVMQRGLDLVMQELYDHLMEIPVHRVRVIESVQRDQGHRIVATSQQNAAMLERISTLKTMSIATRPGVTQDSINELIAKHVKEALQAYDAAKNHGTEMEIENEQQDDNVDVNVNNGNSNINGNGNPNENNRGVVLVTQECTYQDFVKCQPLHFKGTKGVVGLRKQRRIVGVDAAYAMTWKALMKLMTEGNILTAYNQKFKELTLLCTKMDAKEENQVGKYIRGHSDKIQKNVISAEPVRL
nr:hypothetical protein [Tanacetum cinerariifolium]